MVDFRRSTRGADPRSWRRCGVPRHAFVSASRARSAYDDEPLPIGEGQTISQPYIVAAMIEAVQPKTGDRASRSVPARYPAVLATIVAEVYTIERASLKSAARTICGAPEWKMSPSNPATLRGAGTSTRPTT